MEKLSMAYDKEYMKIAMLKHEETFKQQLYELHRLYRVQKMLMKDMENSRSSFKNSIGLTQNADHFKVTQSKPQLKIDLEQPAEEHIEELDDDDPVIEIVDETEIELTLGPSSYYHNRKKSLETPRTTSDSGHSLSSSSTGSSQMNKTSSRTQHFSEATREEELSGSMLRLVQVPDSNSIFQRGIRNSFDVEEQSRQDRLKQSPWLLHALSLNMT